VTAAFFVERLMDVVAMVALAALVFSASPRYRGLIVGAGCSALIALLGLALLPWERLTPRATLGRFAGALAAIRSLLRPIPLLTGFGIGLAAWVLEGLGLGVLSSLAPGTQVDVPTAVGIYAVAVLAGGLSFVPGGLGGTEAVMTALLAAQGLAVSQALLVTLACRLVTLWLAVALGWLAVLVLRPRSVSMVPPWQ
jgi:uncharacterized protein (TIRG00374 family)